MAAVNIAKFFKAFPDLEEDAINAVYDLCEDQDPNVRSCFVSVTTDSSAIDTNRGIQGYRSDVRGTA